MAATLPVVFAFATASVLAAVAVALFLSRPDRPAVRIFAALLLLRAVGSAAYAAGQAAEGTGATLWWDTTPYFVIALTFVAVAFAATYPTPVRGRAGVLVGLVALLVACEAAYAVDHGAFWDLATLASGSSGPQGGAAVGPLFAFYGLFDLAYAAVVLRCAMAARRAPGTLTSRNHLLVATGFAVAVVYDSASLLLLFPEFAFDRPPFVAAVLTISLVGALLTVVAAVLLTARSASRGGAGRAFVALPVAAAASVAVVAALPEPVVATSAAAQGVSLVWRLALPLLVTYALVRYHLFDIDLRLKLTVRRGTVAAAFFAVFVVASQVAENALDARFGYLTGGLAAGVLLLALAPLQRAAERVAEAAFPGVGDRPDYHAYRRLVVYRAAVEGAWADLKVDPAETAMLARLREELGISRDDAAAVESEVERAIGRGPSAQTS